MLPRAPEIKGPFLPAQSGPTALGGETMKSGEDVACLRGFEPLTFGSGVLSSALLDIMMLRPSLFMPPNSWMITEARKSKESILPLLLTFSFADLYTLEGQSNNKKLLHPILSFKQ